jgi:hypothetical protein
MRNRRAACEEAIHKGRDEPRGLQKWKSWTARRASASPPSAGPSTFRSLPGRQKLRREVEWLLTEDGSAGPMERPALDVAAYLLGTSTVTQVDLGTQVGRYKIEGLIGGREGPDLPCLRLRPGRRVARIEVLRYQYPISWHWRTSSTATWAFSLSGCVLARLI